LQGCLDMVAQFNASTGALPEAHKEWQYLSAPVVMVTTSSAGSAFLPVLIRGSRL
jgi:hypothetical protein